MQRWLTTSGAMGDPRGWITVIPATPVPRGGRALRGWTANREIFFFFFQYFSLFLLRGNAIFKKKYPKYSRFARSYPPPSFPLSTFSQRVSKFRGARIICMLLERLKNWAWRIIFLVLASFVTGACLVEIFMINASR